MNTNPTEMTQYASGIAGPVFHGVVLSILCVISFSLITHLLAHAFSVSRDDDLLGGMWAVVATVFVYRYSYAQNYHRCVVADIRNAGEFCALFSLPALFSFNPWGMATLIGAGAIVMLWLRRPDDVVTTGITTAVVMIAAAISPDHAWKQPLLRVVDTVVGTGVGIMGAWITAKRPQRERKMADP
jgi:uncharacterized membrane protein YccC